MKPNRVKPRAVLRAARTLPPALALASALALSVGPATAAAPGESWEYSGQMQMMGMQMPMPPQQVCHKAGDTAVPPVDKRCKTQDIKATGSKATFRIVCGPPDPMEGSGEITRKGDRSEAVYRLKSTQGELVMTMNGRKLGPCAAQK